MRYIKISFIFLLFTINGVAQNNRQEITDSIQTILQSNNRIKASQLRDVLNIMTNSTYTILESDEIQKEVPAVYITSGRTLLSTDTGKTIFVYGTDGITDTITIPVDVLKVNQYLNVIQYGTDEVYFKAAPGAVIESFEDRVTISGRYAPATILYHSNDSTVVVLGNLK